MCSNQERGPYLRQGSFSETHVRSYEGEIQGSHPNHTPMLKRVKIQQALEVDEGDREKYFVYDFRNRKRRHWILGRIRWRIWIIWQTLEFNVVEEFSDTHTDPIEESGSGTALARGIWMDSKLSFPTEMNPLSSNFPVIKPLKWMMNLVQTAQQQEITVFFETNGDTVVVTIYGNDRANDIYTLNFSTEITENGDITKTLYICNQTK